jgi:SOS-response transcriptional repressor LexA
MGALAFQTARKAQYAVLELALPGRPKANAGVLLLDPSTGQLLLKLRSDWAEVAEPEDAEVLSHVAEDLAQRAKETGGGDLLGYLEETLSNVLRISPRETIAVGNLQKALERLYARHVEGERGGVAEVRRFETHLPLYSLRAAATRFGEDMEIEAEQWVRVPENLRLTSDMFVGRVVGRSMEPLIPDGSLCIFRHSVVGSRQGKLLLIQQLGASESGGEFTVKRYTSRKAATEEGWWHEGVRLEPINPEFQPWDLTPSELEDGPYRVRGEFIRVLPYEEQ